MLLLFESPAGYALFKILDEKKIESAENIWKEFETPSKAEKIVKLKGFAPFANTTEAVTAAVDLVESRLGKSLKAFLKKTILKENITDTLAVCDSQLGRAIKEKLSIPCLYDNRIMELTRGIRGQMESLLSDVTSEHDLKAMQLGLSHSLSRYKLKFSPDKVDTMIVHSIGLLDDLDKEINTYAMRVREWYGWHFPEMSKIVTDNMQFSKSVIKMGFRSNAAECEFGDIFEDEETIALLKDSAEISMGTEITEGDLVNIQSLAKQVLDLTEYRAELFEYLKNRMNAIAPNLSFMVGELVGARLIAHAGSLMNLAKHPASTVQILGAEKALFRALKTKHDTPKYGLIYHASLIGQAGTKNKGKISRVLAAKTALSIRVDALGEADGPTIALDSRTKVEQRLRQLEGGTRLSLTGSKTQTNIPKYEKPAKKESYNTSSDVVEVVKEKKSKKRSVEEIETVEEPEVDNSEKKKKKKTKV